MSETIKINEEYINSPWKFVLRVVVLQEEKYVLVVAVCGGLESVVSVLVGQSRIGAKFEELLHRPQLTPVNLISNFFYTLERLYNMNPYCLCEKTLKFESPDIRKP